MVKSNRFEELNFETLDQYKHKAKKRISKTKTLSGNVLKIKDGPIFKIPANSSKEVVMKLKSKKPESFDEYFEILVNQ